MKIVTTLAAGLLALLCSAAFAAVDVNKASQAELEAIKGIGPATAARILEARKSAAFKDWGDLQSRVKGVGDARSARLSADGLTVDGAPFKAGNGALTAKTPRAAHGGARSAGRGAAASDKPGRDEKAAKSAKPAKPAKAAKGDPAEPKSAPTPNPA